MSDDHEMFPSILKGLVLGETDQLRADRVMREQLIARLRARVAELEAERDDFHMAYRMKCDEQTKALHAENARLRAALEAAPEPMQYTIIQNDGTVLKIGYPLDQPYGEWFNTTRAEALK